MTNLNVSKQQNERNWEQGKHIENVLEIERVLAIGGELLHDGVAHPLDLRAREVDDVVGDIRQPRWEI